MPKKPKATPTNYNTNMVQTRLPPQTLADFCSEVVKEKCTPSELLRRIVTERYA